MQKKNTPTPHLAFVTALLLSAVLLAGCSSSGAMAATSWAGLAVDETSAYVAFNQAIYAVDLESGLQRWRFPNEADRSISFYSPPSVSEDGVIYAGGFNNVLYALDASNGSMIWRFQGAGGRIIGGTTIAGDLVLLPSADGVLYAINRLNGAPLWQFETGAALWSQPSVDEKRVYLAALDHHVYALNLADGALLWSHDLGAATTSTPLLINDQVIVGSFASQLISLDAASGTPRWTFDAAGWVWGAAAADGQSAYFGDVNGGLYALNLEDGQQLWKHQDGGPVVGKPLVDGGKVFFITETGIFSYTTDAGVPVWQKPFDSKLYSDPILVNGILLVSSIDPDQLLTAINAESGANRWTFSSTDS